MLFPEKIDAETVHQRDEVVGDFLQHFGPRLDPGEKLRAGVNQLGWYHGIHYPLDEGGRVCLVAAAVRCGEEEDAVCGYENGAEMLDLVSCSAC